jgi:hypothetical protein
MVRLLGLELSSGRLALRAVLAVVVALVAFAFFYLIPAMIPGIAKQLAGSANSSAVSGIVNSLVNPELPAIGLAVTALMFLGVFLRGTKVYGPVLIVLGLALAAYVFAFFQGGTINLAIPSISQYMASGSVAISLAGLMYLFMLGPLLTVLKGVVLTVMKPGESAKAPLPQ